MRDIPLKKKTKKGCAKKGTLFFVVMMKEP
jgi:hypothetical protein